MTEADDMSLRDWFAGQAVPEAIRIVRENPSIYRTGREPPRFVAAEIAWGIADAMLAERARGEVAACRRVALADLREQLLAAALQCEEKPSRSKGVAKWCAKHGVHHGHVGQFLKGRRGPPADMLEAMGLEWAIVNKVDPSDLTTASKAAKGDK
jgi:hypothetical protein